MSISSKEIADETLQDVIQSEGADQSANNQNLSLCGRNLTISKSQFYIIILLCPYFFLTSSYYSLFAPFFPGEALKKNITQTQVGLIFGIFQLAF